MKRAILLTGFNNWGKTTIIKELFGRGKFYMGWPYGISDVKASFTVESHSNDDTTEEGFVNSIAERLSRAPQEVSDLFCAFCPTRQTNNDSRRILENPVFTQFDEIHLILLKYKWDFHAELKIPEIHAHLSGIANVRFLTINADANQTTDVTRSDARIQQIVSYLQQIYP
jgi:hypothetical protein